MGRVKINPHDIAKEHGYTSEYVENTLSSILHICRHKHQSRLSEFIDAHVNRTFLMVMASINAMAVYRFIFQLTGESRPLGMRAGAAFIEDRVTPAFLMVIVGQSTKAVHGLINHAMEVLPKCKRAAFLKKHIIKKLLIAIADQDGEFARGLIDLAIKYKLKGFSKTPAGHSPQGRDMFVVTIPSGDVFITGGKFFGTAQQLKALYIERNTLHGLEPVAQRVQHLIQKHSASIAFGTVTHPVSSLRRLESAFRVLSGRRRTAPKV